MALDYLGEFEKMGENISQIFTLLSTSMLSEVGY